MHQIYIAIYLISSLILVNCNYWANGITSPVQISQNNKTRNVPFNLNRRKKKKKVHSQPNLTLNAARNLSHDQSKHVHAPSNDYNINNSNYLNIKTKYPGRRVSSKHSSVISSGGSAIISNSSISSSPNYRIFSNYNNSIIKSPFNGLKIQESTDVVIYRNVPVNCRQNSHTSSNVNFYQVNLEKHLPKNVKRKGM